MEAPPRHVNVYHIAGLDERERGFNRQAQITVNPGGAQARLRYEQLHIQVDVVPSEDLALHRLIGALQERGYRQLRTQCIFQNDQYLGNQQPWVDYPDPEIPSIPPPSWIEWIRRLFPSLRKS